MKREMLDREEVLKVVMQFAFTVPVVEPRAICNAIAEMPTITNYAVIPKSFCSICSGDECENCYMPSNGIPSKFISDYASEEQIGCR